MTRATAQIVILLDPETGEFRAEMGSPNGSRRKIPLPPDASLWGDTIGVELLELNSWLRDQEERAKELKEFTKSKVTIAEGEFKLSLHRKVWDKTASRNYGNFDSVSFANEKFGSRRDANFQVISVEKILRREK